MSNQFTFNNCTSFIQKSFLIVAIFALSLSARSQMINGYSKASYTPAQSGKFMKTWLVAGPFSVNSDAGSPAYSVQEESFKKDIITHASVVAGKPVPPVSAASNNFKWQQLTSADDIVNLDDFYKKKDFAYAYAVAEIKALAPGKVMLAVGSDDAIKIWHNGKLVHENWTPRGAVKDNDLVP